jgi:hypothetical protein
LLLISIRSGIDKKKYILSQICWVGSEEKNCILGRKILAPAGSYFLSSETRQALLLTENTLSLDCLIFSRNLANIRLYIWKWEPLDKNILLLNYMPARARIFRPSMQLLSSNPTQQICDNIYLPLFFNLHNNYIYRLNNLFLLLWL